VIPTFNRLRELSLCLDGFTHQTASRKHFEIIVVDDGSTADIASAGSGFARTMNLRLIRSAHVGPGAARNIAIKRARAPLLILYDDDLRPLPDLVEYCLDFHRVHSLESEMALLRFEPDAAIADSLFVIWAFSRLYPFPRMPEVGGWGRFWSGTLTCKKSVFRHGQFDPAYQMLEDAELGLRLSRRVDLQVHFEPRLTGTLTRRLTLQQICRRQYMVGYFSHVLAREHRGAVDFFYPPYNNPEKYFVDRQRLAAIIASACGIESCGLKLNGSSSSEPSKLLSALWSTAEIHARAEGWMAARDGQPAAPPGTLGSLSESDGPTPR